MWFRSLWKSFGRTSRSPRLGDSKRAIRQPRQTSLRVEPLELRTLLSVDITSKYGDPIVFTGGATDDDFILTVDSSGDFTHNLFGMGGIGGVGNYADEFDFDPSPGASQHVVAAIALSITVNLGGGDDSLTFDFGGGGFSANNGVMYNAGGDAGDSLVLRNGTIAADAVRYTFASEHDGSVNIGNTSLSYTGLDPVDDNLNAVDRAFRFMGGSETITISDDGTVANNRSRVVSTRGGNVTFTNPTGSLSIDASVGAGADEITLEALDSSFSASGVYVLGTAASDTINIEAAQAVVTRVNGLGGADMINIGGTHLLDRIAKSVTVVSTGTGGTATLTIDDSATTLAKHVTITSSSVTGAAGGTITYGAGIAAITYYGGFGDDAISLAPSATVLMAVSGGLGDDTLTVVNSSAAATVTDTSVTVLGFATVTYVAMEDLLLSGAGAVTFSGTTGSDTFVVDPETHTAQIKGGPVIGFPAATSLTVDSLGGTDLVEIVGMSGDDDITVSRGATTTVRLAGVAVSVGASDVLLVSAGLGDDTITLTGSGGPALTIDGGMPSASDELIIANSATGTTVVTPGETPDAGAVSSPDGAVSFAGIELVSIIAAAASDVLEIHGTQGNDAIAAANLGTGNRVWVNDRAPLEFATFGTLSLLGEAGDDAITVSPVGLTGVANISVDGGLATMKDELAVRESAAANTVRYLPTAADAGSVTTSGSATVWFATTEALLIDGQGGSDSLTVVGTSGDDLIAVTLGSAVDAGIATVNSLSPLSYHNLGSNGTLAIDGAAGSNDRLVINGTAADEEFSMAASSGIVTVVQNGTSSALQLPVSQTDIELLTLCGMEGDDDFHVAGPVPSGLRRITLSGGDPSGSDTATLIDTASSITVNITASPASAFSTGLGSVSLPGIEAVTVMAGTHDISVHGNSSPHCFEVTPSGPDEATVRADGTVPIVYTSSTGQLNVDGGGSAGDTLAVNLSNADETVTVNGLLIQVTAGSSLKTVNYSGMDALTVNGAAGSDTFNVTPAAVVPILLDGGDPIGVLPGDRVVVNAGTAAVTFTPGPQTDEGGFAVGISTPVSYDHIESVTINGPGAVTVQGTDGDDNITVIARDGTYDTGVDGLQDFTVAINDGPEVLYLNAASLTVDALDGSDEISVQTLAGWGVTLTIDGGLPTASDTLILGTPGTTDAVNYVPSGMDSGTLTIANLSTTFYISQVEHLAYDGEAGNDTLTVTGSGADDTFVHTPGAAIDAGVIAVDSLLPLNYQNLGAAATLTAAGASGTGDKLVVRGTDDDDTFGVAATSGNVGLSNASGIRIGLLQTGVERLVLEGLAGDDAFMVAGGHGYTAVNISGGEPSETDVVTLTGNGSAVTVQMGTSPVSTTDGIVTGGGLGTVNLSGVEVANVVAATGNVTVNGTAEDDDLEYKPSGAEEGSIRKAGLNLVVNSSGVGSLTADGVSGDDRLTFLGTASADVFTVSGVAVLVTGLQGVNTLSNVDALTVLGEEGADTFALTAGAVPIFVDGGDTVGGASDALMILVGAASATFHLGLETDEGSFAIGGATGLVNFDHLKSLTVTGMSVAGNVATVNGTTADNDIALLATGVDDFTVSVDGTLVSFSNFASAALNGSGGNDDFTVTPYMAGNVALISTVTVDGGPPAGSVGDRLQVDGSALADTMSVNLATGMVDPGAAGNITFTAMESLLLNTGEGVDSLSVSGSATYEYRLGASAGAGMFLTDDVPLAFTGLAGGETLNLAGASLVAQGTDSNNAFVLSAGGLMVDGGVTIMRTGLTTLTLAGVAGDDAFMVAGGHGYTAVNISGGEPSATDVATLTGNGSAVTVQMGTSPVSTTDGVVTGGGLGTVNLSGVEVANVVAATGNVTVNGTAEDDDLEYKPSEAEAGMIGKTGLNLVVNLAGVGNLAVDGVSGDDRLTFLGTASADAFTVSDAAVLVTGSQGVNTLSNVDALTVLGEEGTDTFVVTAGAAPIFVDGGDAVGGTCDALTISAGAARATFHVGPETDEGSLAIGGATGLVSFDHLESLTVTGTSAAGNVATVNGTTADNDITLLATGADDFTVSVDGALASFSNFASVVLNGSDGDDDFTVTPYTAGNVALTSTVTVDGGPPAGSVGDRLQVDGSALADTMSVNLATGMVDPGAAGNITFTAMESLSLNAGEGVDALGVSGSATYDYRPGASVGAGMLLTDGAPLAFTGLAGGETLTLAGTNLVAQGTDSNNAFVLSTSGLVMDGGVTIMRTGLTTLTLAGLAGDDAFTVAGGHGYTAVNISGGEPSATDVATLTGNGSAVTVQMGTSPVSTTDGVVTGGGLGTVSLSGVEVANVVAATGNVTVNGTAEDDDLEYKPSGAEAGTIRKSGLNLVVNLAGVGNLTLDGVSGDDRLTFLGTASADAFIASGVAVLLTGLQGVNTLSNVDALTLMGEEGNDSFNVTAGALPISVEGGDPIGTTGGDRIVVQAGGNPVAWEPGPLTDQGGFIVDALARISYVHIEGLAVTGATCALIVGTNADNDITVIARDVSYDAAADGVQDFTASFDNWPALLWIDVPHMLIDGLSGDDDITLRAPSPNLAAWNVNVDIFGGAPAAPENGDRLVVETPGSQTVTYTPASFDSGRTVVRDAGTNALVADISISQSPSPFPACPGISYAPSAGGIEWVIYDGQGGNDALTVVGTSANDNFTHAPGNAADEGEIQVNRLLGIDYQNLGASGAVTISGAGGSGDNLAVLGTAVDDTFVVAGTAAVVVNSQLVLATIAVENYSLKSLTGDDTFKITPVTGIAIRTEGDEPSASDTLLFTRVVAGAPQVVVDLDATPGSPLLVQTITQPGFGAVTVSGIELAVIDAAAGNLYVSGTRNDDVITYTPTSASAGTFSADGIATIFAFVNVPQATSTFAITGGSAGYSDTVVVSGSGGKDLIRVNAATRTVQVARQTVSLTIDWRDVWLDNGTSPFGVTGAIESVVARGNAGVDTFHVVPAPAVGDGLFIAVVGGPGNTSDALVITGLSVSNAPLPLASTDFVIDSKSRTEDAGTILACRSTARMPDIVYESVEIVSLNVYVNGSGNPNALVLGPDDYEENEYRAMSAHLGSGAAINVTNLAISPNASEYVGMPADQDWFRIVALDTGTLDVQVYYDLYAGLLPDAGNLVVEAWDNSVSGNLIASSATAVFGAVNTTTGDARVRIPAVAGQTYFVRVRGANMAVVNGYDMTIANEAPPVPENLELLDSPVGDAANSDTGRSEYDNITRDNTPTIVLRLDDGIFLHDLPGNATNDTPLAGVIPIPFQSNLLAAGYAIAIFDEGSSGTQTGTAPQTPVGYAVATAREGVYTYTFTAPLTDGSHFLTARVAMIDPATPHQSGYGGRGLALEIVVDTVYPPVSFGLPTVADDGLVADSDTGVSPPNPDTITDNVTSDTTPAFWGRAEADAIVRLYADVNGNGTLEIGTDVFLGQATTVPLDGANQESDGYWEILSVIDLNDPTFFPVADGLRTIFVTAEDVAGNVNAPAGAADVLEILIDTQGPVINGVFVTDVELVGLGTGNTLVRFNSYDPAAILATVAVSGLTAGDVVVGIDVRPADGQLYALADGTPADRVYRVNPVTGEATLVATLNTNLSGASFGVDFDPVADRLRVASDLDQNLRVNVTTGFVTVDAPLGPGNPTVVAAAYSNKTLFGTATLYTIDTAADTLNVQNPAIAGTQVTVGPLGVNATNVAGFDLAPGSNQAFAALTVAGVTRLYRLDLATGAATLVDSIGSGATPLRGLAALPAYDLFDPKPSSDGPTPLVHSLTITLTDLPLRVAPGFFYDALKQDIAEDPGHYQLVGDANGVIAIQEVIVTQFIGSDNVALATVELVFFEPLPDDRFTLTISDALTDPGGNSLDGESNAVEPQEGPSFPTGDGVPGGDFVARFTVDSRPEIGTWAAGSVYVDINGNFIYDPDTLDATNRDFAYIMGYTSDDVFCGNFTASNNDLADGFDKLAVYGKDTTSHYRWIVDTDNDGVGDLKQYDLAEINGLPVSGDFDRQPNNGDEVGVFSGSAWYLDANHDYQVDKTVTTALRGYPITGDFDGDGYTDLATYTKGYFYFDLTDGLQNGWDGALDYTIRTPFLAFIGTNERPVAADMNQDGITDIGLWVPDRSGVDGKLGEWFFLVSDQQAGIPANYGTVAAILPEFSTTPLGNDLFAQFGDEFALPIVGNFDPPVTDGDAPDPSTLDLAGTSGNDTLSVTPGTEPGTWMVNLNGSLCTLRGDSVSLTFDGLDGTDTVSITGGDDGGAQSELDSEQVSVVGTGYSFLVKDAEIVGVTVGGDDNSALFHGTAGSDVFNATPVTASLKSGGASLSVHGASKVSVEGGTGGRDTANLTGSSGDDEFVGAVGECTLQGDGFSLDVHGFYAVYAYALSGANDSARLQGSPGTDCLTASPSTATLQGTPYIVRVKDFDTVQASGEAGADTALLTGTSGSDSLTATPSGAGLSGRGFDIEETGFEHLRVYSNGGYDTARLYDSAGNDALTASYAQAKLIGSGYDIKAYQFKCLYAYASTGTDSASFLDSPNNDTFTATPTYARLLGSSYSIYTRLFDVVNVCAIAGGMDTAHLYGALGRRDVLTSTATYSALSGSGYSILASSFEIVNVFGLSGGDRAVLHDAVLEGPLTDAPVGTLSTSHRRVVWLSHFMEIQVKRQGTTVVQAQGAVDRVFAAYW